MDELIGMVAVVLIFGGATAVFLANSQIGKAIADRIRGGPNPTAGNLHGVDDQIEGLAEEVESLRAEFTDMQERLDFTERLLARGSEPSKVDPGSV